MSEGRNGLKVGVRQQAGGLLRSRWGSSSAGFVRWQGPPDEGVEFISTNRIMSRSASVRGSASVVRCVALSRVCA